jgi:hypothetical protein
MHYLLLDMTLKGHREFYLDQLNKQLNFGEDVEIVMKQLISKKLVRKSEGTYALEPRKSLEESSEPTAQAEAT